jgi:SAM-dependent methyltransferase
VTQLCQRRDTCRLCGSRDLERVLSLTPTPPANAFVRADQLDVPQPVFPLDLYFCQACGHVQLLDVVDPAYLFADYVYVSGTSRVFVEHFRRYADGIIREYLPAPPARIVDIGSNDGTLLRRFADRGYTVLGVDPARAIAAAATASGIPTVAEFFTPQLAKRLRDAEGPAHVVTANNVFAHADDLEAIVDGVRVLLDPTGVFVFEVSYLGDVVDGLLFDTIYHEHLAYHTVGPLVGFLRRHGLELIRVQHVDTHGGSIRCVVQHAGGERTADGTVGPVVEHEQRAGLDRPDTLIAFARRVEALRERFRGLVNDLRAKGRRIAGFGAPAKATTLMYHFGIGPETVEFIVDDSPLKQHLFTPGLHIPVLPVEELYRRRPDDVVILAWNFAESIMRCHNALRRWGTRFIVPLPAPSVIGAA